MKRGFDRLFIAYCALWCVVRFSRWIAHPLPWINNWLTDFLFVPVMAHLSLNITRRFIVRDGNYRYPVSYLLFMAGYASIVFEYVMPEVSLRYTSDPLDALMYFLGSIFYYYVHQGRVQKRTPLAGTGHLENN